MFISTYYEIAFERFSNVIDNFGSELYEVLHISHRIGEFSRLLQYDASELIYKIENIDFFDVFDEILYLLGYSVKL